MSSVNKVILVGRVGQDPEVKHLPSGGQVVNISVATTETWKDKQTGQKMEETEWSNVSYFGRTAEIVGEYVRKGTLIYIEGSLKTRKYQAQDGSDRYSTGIKGHVMQILSSKSDSAGSQPAQHQPAPQQRAPAPQQAPQHAPPPANNGVPQGHDGFDDSDEDIPF